MGLMIYSLDNIPENANRDYFIYLLDYGWDEPIRNILNRNFEKMANIAAKNSAVVIKGIAEHFENEVFSYHSINGINDRDILPALLITNEHPEYFKKNTSRLKYDNFCQKDEFKKIKSILIPFKKFCSNETDVINLIDSLFDNIVSKKDFESFSFLQEIGRSKKDFIILEPNIYGIGLNLKNLFDNFKTKNR